ncbi:MAG: MxaL protein [Gammaproteobacteria bacterium]|nr:MxaL protein [Gammaproteobacteria bacterium]
MPRPASRLTLQRLLLALACLALSMAVFAPPIKLDRSVFDLLVAVDITQSMNVRDYRLAGEPVTRLAFVKHALREALFELPCGSKLGLAIFTEYRTLVLLTPVEVCRNQAELADAVQGLSGQMAWAGDSEIAKGLFSAVQGVRDLSDRPALVFITDGHEAPPVNARYRLIFEGQRGEVRGVIMGTGGLMPQPIPKVGPDGKEHGFWRADEVIQTDLYTRGRGGSVANEQMVETRPALPSQLAPPTQKREHFSALHEDYLRQLASETGLSYRRLTDVASLADALSGAPLARRATVQTDLRWVAGSLGLLALVTGNIPARQNRQRHGNPQGRTRMRRRWSFASWHQ